MALPFSALYKYVITYRYQGQDVQNVLWFMTKPTSPKTDVKAELEAIMTEVSSWFTLNVVLFANAGLEVKTAVGQVMNGPQPYQAILNYQNTFGQIAGDGLPAHDAAVISLYTPFHGRSLHGRIYIPAISEADHAGGNLTSAATTRLNKIASDYLTRFGENGTSSFIWGGVFSRKNGVVRMPGPPPFLSYNYLGFNPATRTVATSLVRTQRHRLIR